MKMNFIQKYFKEHGERVVYKGYEIYYTKDSAIERTGMVNGVVTKADEIFSGDSTDMFDKLISQYEINRYNNNLESRRKEVIEKFERGVAGIVALKTINQLKDDLIKETNKLLREGEVLFSIKYDLTIEYGKINDKYSFDVTYLNREEDEKVRLTFQCHSIELIFKQTFIDRLADLLNDSKAKTEEEYFKDFERVNNSTMYNTNVELIKVTVYER